MPFILIPISIVVLGILGISHAVVYEALITIFSLLWPGFLTWHAIIGLRIIFILLAVSFTIMTVLSFYSRNFITRFFYKIASVWTGLLMYFFFAAFAYGTLIFFNNILVDRIGSINHAHFFSGIGLFLYVLALLIGVYGVIHSNHTLITNVKVRLAGLPQAWKTKKAVWISDIHLGHNRGAQFMERIVAKIQALKPDIVFIGGDLFDGVKIDEHKAIASLKELCAPGAVKNGVYFIMGNHEQFSVKSTARFLDAIKSIPGLRVLDDEFVTVDGVDIIGVDHGHSENAEKFSAVLSKIKAGMKSDLKSQPRPSLLLKHEPRDLDVAVKADISFQISGHTHQGQVFPVTLFAWMIFPGYNYGLHERGKMQVYTSSGVGTWGPPLRVGTKSEIVLFEFE